MTDAPICGRFMVELLIVCAELTGNPDVPPTASGMSHHSPVWSEKADKVRTRTTEVMVPGRGDHALFVTKTYQGGVKSAFYMGPTPLGK